MMVYEKINDAVKNFSEYDALFSKVNPGETDLSKINDIIRSKKENALKMALETRKFEIGLYWTRAAYFWAFIAVMFTAYFMIFNAEGWEIVLCRNELLIGVSALGLFLSMCWFCVNKGSKYWQENWEQHVDLLENDVMGPLYKTTKACESGFSNMFGFWHAYKYSVGKINILISAVISVVWGILLLQRVIFCVGEELSSQSIFVIVVILLLLLFFSFCLFLGCVSTDSNGNKIVKLDCREIKKEDKHG